VNWSELFYLISSVTTIGSVAATILWAVARMKVQGEMLAESIKSLGRSVERLGNKLDRIADRTGEHAERLARIESSIGGDTSKRPRN
jgi:hypothetical protein